MIAAEEKGPSHDRNDQGRDPGGARTVELYTNARMTENLRLYPSLAYVETGRRVEDGFDRVFFRKVLDGTARC